MTSPCTVLILANDEHQLGELLSLLRGVMNKVPGAQVLVAVTCRSQGPGQEPVQVSKTAEKTVTSVFANQPGKTRKHLPDEQTLVSRLTERVQKALSTNLGVNENVFTIDIPTQEGLSQLRHEVLMSLTRKQEGTLPAPQLPPPLSEHVVYRVVSEMAQSGTVLLPRKHFADTLRNRLMSQYAKDWKETYLDDVLNFLCCTGHIAEFPLTKDIDNITSEPTLSNEETSARSRKASIPKKDTRVVTKAADRTALVVVVAVVVVVVVVVVIVVVVVVVVVVAAKK
ncbi:hypothetical protein ElyMa_005407900 [Elysia marginata]|uniref:Uncharacterized protein n=1 Tax=Elysia marginata TaxID=1093978 RepID=A0AAV4EI74_9GAST|nr:hypothetical protein ElyMa_005407900 [Elysia marginata]